MLSQQDTGSTATGEEKDLLHRRSAEGGARAAATATTFIRHQNRQKRRRAGTERARLFKRLGDWSRREKEGAGGAAFLGLIAISRQLLVKNLSWKVTGGQ